MKLHATFSFLYVKTEYTFVTFEYERTIILEWSLTSLHLNFFNSYKGHIISKCLFWCLQLPPKTNEKQVDLRFHSSRVEFVRSFFGGNVYLKKSFQLFLTFN